MHRLLKLKPGLWRNWRTIIKGIIKAPHACIMGGTKMDGVVLDGNWRGERGLGGGGHAFTAVPRPAWGRGPSFLVLLQKPFEQAGDAADDTVAGQADG